MSRVAPARWPERLAGERFRLFQAFKPKERDMDSTTLLIILILVLLIFGGGWYGRGRWF